MMMRAENIGPSFASFLEEEGIKDDVYATAVKRVLAWQLENAMKEANLNKVEMAKKMQTSRAQLDRVLDPTNDQVRLDTMERAARAVGRRLVIALE